VSNVPIVMDFHDVFPNELPGVPSEREVEVTIDVLLGTSLITQSPCRMVLSELAELKIQL